MRICVCVCVFVQIVLKWPQDFLLVITLWWHEADDQLKNLLGKYPIRALLWGSSTPQTATAFSQPFFLFRFLHHTERQGSSCHTWTCMHMNTWEKNTCTHTHTHPRGTPYYSLLICRALIETPLSPSCTCIPSLIISQGAFGGRTEGDGGGRRGLPSLVWQASCTSTDLTELNLAASWCLLPFPSVEKLCLEQNTCGSMDLYSVCRGWL